MGSQSVEATQRNHTIVLRKSRYENHSFSNQPCKPCARRESIPSNCSGRCGDQASREGSWSGHNTSGAAYSSQGSGSFRGSSPPFLFALLLEASYSSLWLSSLSPLLSGGGNGLGCTMFRKAKALPLEITK